MSWEEYILRDLVTLKQGFALNKKSQHYLSGDNTGLPLLKISDLINGTETLFVKNTIPEQFLVTPSEIIYSRTGQVGLAFMGKSGVVYNNCFKVIPNEKLDSVFIFHWLNSKPIRDYIKSLATGAAQPDLNHDAFKSVKINLPPLQTQKRIASILSAYDDLIENNLKRIKLLEETAQNIYKEWFVNFRFPNYENTPINQETGLPEGWEKVNLYDFAEVKMGFPFKADDFNEANIGKPAIRIRDIPNNWTKTYTTQEVSEDYTVEQGDILIGMDGFFYLEIWGGQKGYLVQRVCRLRSFQKELQGFLFEALREPIKYYEKTISGATVAHLGAKHLKEIFITVPKGVLIIEQLGVFNKIANQKITLLNQNQKLKEARDILLPRLMNRTIEV
jgi:type I restriction enzyme S subunit